MPLMSTRAFIIHLWCSCIPLKKQARKKLRTTWWQVNDKNNILDELLLSYSWNIRYTYIHISQSLRRNENRKKREMSECKSKDFYSLLPQRNSKQHATSTNLHPIYSWRRNNQDQMLKIFPSFLQSVCNVSCHCWYLFRKLSWF